MLSTPANGSSLGAATRFHSLQHQATRQRGNASLGAVAALDRLLDDRTNARVLDAPGVPFGKWKHLGEPFLCDQLEEVAVPGEAPTVEPE